MEGLCREGICRERYGAARPHADHHSLALARALVQASWHPMAAEVPPHGTADGQILPRNVCGELLKQESL